MVLESNFKRPSPTCMHCKSRTVNVRCDICSNIGVDSWYCNKFHKEIDAKNHEENHCKSFVIRRNDTSGRYYSATRPIKQGELILREKPLVLGPLKSIIPACLTCNKSVDHGYRCTKCHWPMCSSRCEESPIHAPECKLTSALIGKTIRNYDVPNPFYEYILPLRCLYTRETDPIAYKILTKLVSHADKRAARGRDRDATDLIKYFNLENYTEEEVKHICGVIEVNKFALPQKIAVGIYNRASLFAHSCVPNAYKSFTVNYEIEIKACVDIEQGDIIYISYMSQVPGTFQRQGHLSKHKYFVCQCERCLDPTEFGSYTSSHYCPECIKGYVVPPLFPSKDRWTCQSCGYKFDDDRINKFLEYLGEESHNLKTSEGCAKFLEDTKSILCSNHYLRLQAIIHLTSVIDAQKRLLSKCPIAEERVKHKAAFLPEMFGLADLLSRGYNSTSGMLLSQSLQVLTWEYGATKDKSLKKECLKNLKANAEKVLEIFPRDTACAVERMFIYCADEAVYFVKRKKYQQMKKSRARQNKSLNSSENAD